MIPQMISQLFRQGNGGNTIKPLDKTIGPLRNLRSQAFALPFHLVRLMTRWEFTGKEKLLACIQEHQRTGRGLITVSNHVSLFDDPLVFLAMLEIQQPSELTKCWYSTACADNFNPGGQGVMASVTRSFSEISNMVFLSRAHKRGGTMVEESPIPTLMQRLDHRLERRVAQRAASLKQGLNHYLSSFITPHGQGTPADKVRTFNQSGMIEVCARVDSGDWVHLFPEGGRSRDMHLRPARPGVGKIIYHAGDTPIIPICLYGSQDIMPVGCKMPRLGKNVYVSVGDPILPTELESYRRRPANLETFKSMADLAMDRVNALRPGVLARYLGPTRAAALLQEEAISRQVLSRKNRRSADRDGVEWRLPERRLSQSSAELR